MNVVLGASNRYLLFQTERRLFPMTMLFRELTVSAQVGPLLLVVWLLLQQIVGKPKRAVALAVPSQRERSQ